MVCHIKQSNRYHFQGVSEVHANPTFYFMAEVAMQNLLTNAVWKAILNFCLKRPPVYYCKLCHFGKKQMKLHMYLYNSRFECTSIVHAIFRVI